ncbi:Hsp70 family protein [Dactylosporangium sp. NBC_01737]|uniref:Hsp70 family protein n=1 Tax=Dactylosporangium sp. NBC_01737 TaxID=2975959 RepID=UPI002E10B5F0|nr:Hsp70 family protein [Dactylosporangium sp. NBC_01737]
MRSGFVLGIDFGTSNTVAVLAWPGGPVKPLLFDGSPLLRSAVYLDRSGRLVVGRDAVHSARLDPARFEPNPKRGIDHDAVLLGEAEVPVTDLVAAVLRRVVEEAHRTTGGVAPDRVALTHPASWGPRRRRILLDAAGAAGLASVDLVAEPIAAACAFLNQVRVPVAVGQSLVVYDLGAGTFDVSVVRREAEGFTIVATDGLGDVGGLDVDAAVVGYFGAVYADRAEEWQRLEHPVTAADRRARRQLWDDVQTAKELLSRSGSTVVYLSGLDTEATLGREQLDRLATVLLRRTADLTRIILQRAGIDATATAGVFLVGGASRMPLVATLLHRIVGVPPLVVEQPELVVAEGSVLAVSQPPAAPSAAPPAAPSDAPQAAPPVAKAVKAQVARPVKPPVAEAVKAPVAKAVRPAAAKAVRPAAAKAVRPPVAKAVRRSDDDGIEAFGAYVVSSPWAWLIQPDRGFVMPGRPWHEAPIHPLRITLPSGQGYTIRACFQDPEEVGFLDRDGRPLLFRSTEGLARHLDRDDHLLAGIEGWPRVKDWFANLVLTPDDEDQVDLEIVPLILQHPPAQWLPDVLVRSRDLVAELAAAFALREVSRLIARGSRLDELDDVLRRSQQSVAGWSARRRLRAADAVPAVRDWRRVVDAVDRAVVWEA